jgi:hypothetical protein
LHVSTHDPLPVVVVTDWDTDVSGTCFQNQTAGAVFAELTLLFLSEDAEGFAGEIMANFIMDDPIHVLPSLKITIPC